MKLYGDYHTHTLFSHGTGTIEDNTKAAVKEGVKQIAITDHGLNHIAFGIRRKKIAEMRRQIQEVNQKYDVEVLLGVEADILGFDGQIDIKDGEFGLFDIILCGFHKLVIPKSIPDAIKFIGINNFIDIFKLKASAKQRTKNTQAVINNIQRFPVDVLTHIKHGIDVECKPIAEACASCGTYLEINGKRITYSDKEMEQMLSTDVKFIVNSDAHSPSRIGEFSKAKSIIDRLSIPHDRIVNISDSAPYLRSQSAKASKRY